MSNAVEIFDSISFDEWEIICEETLQELTHGREENENEQ